MNLVFRELHASQPPDSKLRFASAAAETLPDVTAKYDVSAVPTFLFFGHARLVRRRSGADAVALSADVEWLQRADEAALRAAACEMVARLGEITVLMKGTPDNPRCGFSRQVVELLRGEGVVFRHVDILADEEMRVSMKKHADWATYPMVFAHGKLVGGLDILRELKENGTLIEELSKEEGGKAELRPPEKEEAGATEVEGEAEGKTGGEDELTGRLKELTRRAAVMVFMKGEPDAPRCGFSRRIVGLLQEEGVAFGSFDILQDPEVRAGMKVFSDWPTFPQVYANGTFVGGLDVVTELREAGELRGELGIGAM